MSLMSDDLPKTVLLFQIPMRGNEFAPLARDSLRLLLFQIPMRGNESTTRRRCAGRDEVSNPHEG